MFCCLIWDISIRAEGSIYPTSCISTKNKAMKGTLGTLQSSILSGFSPFKWISDLIRQRVTCIIKSIKWTSFLLFRAEPTTYGSSQARGRTGATAAPLHHSHNVGSELTLWPTLQLTECWILDPLIEARDRTASSWILIRFVSPEPWREVPQVNFC